RTARRAGGTAVVEADGDGHGSASASRARQPAGEVGRAARVAVVERDVPGHRAVTRDRERPRDLRDRAGEIAAVGAMAVEVEGEVGQDGALDVERERAAVR